MKMREDKQYQEYLRLKKMRNLLIGSRALNYWFPGCKIKSETDWDVISDEPIEGTEWHNPDFLNNKDFERFTSSFETLKFNGNDFYVVNPFGLAIIKRSHLWRNLSFGKHITHYHKFLKHYCDYESNLYKTRRELSYKEFPQKGPNLNQSVNTFFVDAVTKKFEHDYLHELFAYDGKPMYTKMQRDKTRAWCEKDMWDKFTEHEKLWSVAEETYVIATERFLVPTNFKHYEKMAYVKSLEKVCTTLCKGWFRDYAIDNYPTVLNMFDSNRIAKVKPHLI